MLSANVFEALQNDVVRDCAAFLPELILCGGIVLLLLLRMFSALDRLHLSWVALLVSGGALAAAWSQWTGCCLLSPEQFAKEYGRSDLFSGMLLYDNFTVYLRLFLLGFSLFILWLSLITGIPDREDSADYCTLILGATLGMMVMASTNHLLMMFIGIEMASLPSYALAGYLKGRRDSSEAALKYVVYGGGAAGVMLYGISLLAGKFGTAYLPELATAYVASFRDAGGNVDLVVLMGTLFVLVGIAFKLAAVPFHFWCPDVFEGASAEVAGFLSVASKAAALALLARLVLALAGVGPISGTGGAVEPRVAQLLVPSLALMGIITATFGNLAAFRQTNLKRLLAYSTIAHAGYMLMAIATLDRVGIKAVLVYLAAYFLMNLGAFAVVAFIRNQIGSEELSDYRGLVRRSPWMTITLCVFLLSLLGVPPLVGFLAKIEIFMALWQSAGSYASQPALAGWLYAAFAVLGLNSVLAAVYYIKVMKVMIIEERAEDREGKEVPRLSEPLSARGYAFILSVIVLIGILAWGTIERGSQRGASTPVARAQP